MTTESEPTTGREAECSAVLGWGEPWHVAVGRLTCEGCAVGVLSP